MYEDDRHVDHQGYMQYTGKQRLETATNSLYGIIGGLVADRRVNTTELAALTKWLGNYHEFLDRHPFNELIPHIHAVVADGVIDEEERSDLLWLCERFSGAGNYYDDVTADIQQLHGFLGGIVADGRINKQELDELSAWVDDHAHLRACWPYDELETVIAHVLKDGKIDDQEHEALLQFFGEFTITPGRKAVGALDRSSTVSGVCAFAPEIAFENRFFCFTGASKRSTRSGLVEVIQKLGGEFHKSLRNDTHFLIVGANGNPCWAYSCYGRKVEDAVHRRRNGQRVLIVHELDFWDAVADHGGDTLESVNWATAASSPPLTLPRCAARWSGGPPQTHHRSICATDFRQRLQNKRCGERLASSAM
ncbi:BRCT domain-containing protein [Lacipirellula parvula]|uniref:BRCT domain-containing protein n=1 Tax=Lacipirellula parvula TaxID=2650471 RepID=A0A5K7X9M3_9BACT|nr:BRCT domain-containing protein [Lacipirellula parvula]BBO33238.1 hypothetical protein PLANPX_2850 [Lacipirellula parvula]